MEDHSHTDSNSEVQCFDEAQSIGEHPWCDVAADLNLAVHVAADHVVPDLNLSDLAFLFGWLAVGFEPTD